MAKKEHAKTRAEVKKEEEAVFAAFEIGTGEVSLRKSIIGQRKINGMLYESIQLILKSLPAGPGEGDSAETFKNRKKAKKLNDAIPGKEPPFCEEPRGG